MQAKSCASRSVLADANRRADAMADASMCLQGRRNVVQFAIVGPHWHERLEVWPVFSNETCGGRRGAARVVRMPDDDFYVEEFSKYSSYIVLDHTTGIYPREVHGAMTQFDEPSSQAEVLRYIERAHPVALEMQSADRGRPAAPAPVQCIEWHGGRVFRRIVSKGGRPQLSRP